MQVCSALSTIMWVTRATTGSEQRTGPSAAKQRVASLNWLSTDELLEWGMCNVALDHMSPYFDNYVMLPSGEVNYYTWGGVTPMAGKDSLADTGRMVGMYLRAQQLCPAESAAATLRHGICRTRKPWVAKCWASGRPLPLASNRARRLRRSCAGRARARLGRHDRPLFLQQRLAAAGHGAAW